MSGSRLFQPTLLEEIQVSKKKYLAAHPDPACDSIEINIHMLALSNRRRCILLLRRSKENTDSGKWETPHGVVKDNANDIASAVIRQIEIQTGVELEEKSITFGKTAFFKLEYGRKVCQLNFIFFFDQQPRPHLDEARHDDHEWVTIDSLRKKDFIRRDIEAMAFDVIRKADRDLERFKKTLAL